jgi:alpha-L-fucosidase
MAAKRSRKPTRADTLEWFHDVKFGMFIHWGVYAVLGRGEWIRNVGKIPQDEYDKLPPRFTAKKFEPEAWADLAKRAGMKYMVVTTKHHDGFCMWDTDTTDFKVTNTPFGRDAIAEITTAFRKKGVKVGYYFSIMDWHHDDYLPRLTWEAEARPAEGHDVMDYIKYMRRQIKEIVTQGQPFVLWYDGGWMNTITPEQRIPPTGIVDEDGNPAAWEACITMTGHWWGYDKEETAYKSSEYLIRMLVDIVSKGGNLLLNVGPKADGTIQREFVQRLEAIGKWMDKYSEAIYGTTASPFNLLPFYGRVTTKGDRLYVHVFEWPGDLTLRLPGLKNAVKRVSLVQKGRPRLAFERDGDDLVITLPKKAPDKVAGPGQGCQRHRGGP